MIDAFIELLSDAEDCKGREGVGCGGLLASECENEGLEDEMRLGRQGDQAGVSFRVLSTEWIWGERREGGHFGCCLSHTVQSLPKQDPLS